MDIATKELRTALHIKIITLKRKLNETDKYTNKFVEGELSAENFEPIKRQRQAWRDEINALEAELEALKGGNIK